MTETRRDVLNELINYNNEDGLIRTTHSMNIPLDKLVPCGFNTYEIVGVDDLVNEIKFAGLITPLSVIGPYDDGTYRILSGERRFCALSVMHENDPEQYELVPCSVIGDKDMPLYTQKLIMEIANEGTRQFNSVEHRFNVIELLKEMVNDGALAERKVASKMAALIGVSNKYARYYRSVVFKGLPDLQDLVEKKVVDIKEAGFISQMEKTVQKEIVDRILNGEDVKTILDEYRKPKDTEENPEQLPEEMIAGPENVFDEPSRDPVFEGFREQFNGTYHDPEGSVTGYEKAEPKFSTPATKESVPPSYDPATYDPSTFDASILGPEFGGEADYSQEEEEKSFSTEPDPDEPFPFATLNKWLSYILDKETELTSEEEDIVSLCTEITEKYAY